MSEFEEEDPLDALKSRHSREKKELQGQITSLKHSVNKNDKKRKKEVQAIIEGWENELKRKQNQELEMLTLEQKLTQSATISSAETVEADNNDEVSREDVVEKRKPTRAQLRREKKAEDIRRKLEAAEELEKNAGISQGKIEADEIRKVLQAQNLRLHEIAPDGDCLYNSLAHQINKGREFSGAQLRVIAAKYIREHRDDFIPFLTDEEGELLDDFGFDEYCSKVERTSAQGGVWGGEAELRAISAALRYPIKVVQPNGRSVLFGEEFPSQCLVVTYHRFAYALGEHYNSTVPLTTDSAPNADFGGEFPDNH